MTKTLKQLLEKQSKNYAITEYKYNFEVIEIVKEWLTQKRQEKHYDRLLEQSIWEVIIDELLEEFK